MSRYTNIFNIQITEDSMTRIFFRVRRGPVPGMDMGFAPPPELQADVTMTRSCAESLRDALTSTLLSTEPGTRQ